MTFPPRRTGPGASLVPSPSSYQAGVVVQDDGAYLIFDRTAHGAWQAHDVGYVDTVGDCAAYHVSIPAAVVAVWHWVPVPAIRRRT